MEKKIRVLVVDDSAVIRKLLAKFIESSPYLELVGTAPDPYVAREKLVELKPDVITLDIEMPRMDGLSFLEKIMTFMPTRVLIISSLAKEGSETALRALELGAIDIIEKPAIDVSRTFESMQDNLTSKIIAVAGARIIPRLSRKQTVSKLAAGALAKTTHQLLAIASSTGGTEALKEVLSSFPADIPGTVIVQHMPPGFTRTYADNLNQKFPFDVREACDGDRIVPGRVLIAPGNFHMEVVRNGAFYNVNLHQGPILHGVRPAADLLMKSVAKCVGGNAIGVVLTGMGKDGAEGLLEMRKAGAHTIAQSEKSCVIFGMPKEAINLGAVDEILDLKDIGGALVQHFIKRAGAA